MAVRHRRAGYLRTPISNFPAVDQASLSIFLRVEEMTTSGMFHDVFAGGGLRIYCNGASTDTQQTTVYAQVTTTGGTLTASKTKLKAGSTYHLAIVYDRFDPEAQYFSVNGVKYPFPTTSSQPVGGSNVRYTLGNNGGTIVDHAAGHVLVLRGHALTFAELEAIQEDPPASATIGSGDRLYWSCDGAIGAAAAVGDPGLTVAGSAAKSVVEVLGVTDGASVAYVADLDFHRSAAAGTPYVRSSGGTLCIPLVDARTGRGLTTLPGGLISAPRITIDDGPEIQLPDVEGGAYANDNTACAFFPIPGPRIQPWQAVKVWAPSDWLVTEFGRLAELAGSPVDNRAGRPSSAPVWPIPNPKRVGLNFNSPAVYYSIRHRIQRNLAHNIDTPESLMHDGKLGSNALLRVIQQDGNGVDATGPPLTLGLHAVRWDDPGATAISLAVGTTSYRVDEVLGYRNAGDGSGAGKVRVFDVQKATASPTLAAGLDATATSVRLTGTIEGWMTSVSDRDAYVVVGSEKIRLGSRVGTTDEFSGCTRGWAGTTAAPHAPGAACHVATSMNHGYLMLRFENASGPVRYSNLAVLSPGNWTVPGSVGPASIPPVAWDELDCDFLEKFQGGMGLMRFMDSTSTFYTCQEVEHVSRKDAPHWGAPRWADQLRFSQVRPFDRAASPHIYSHLDTPGLGAETFPASLETPLGVQAAGSEVVATLATAEGDQLCYGTRLMRGGETLRVAAILGGGSYRLVRGVDGTTPVAHAAGPMTAGWRVRLNSDAQWNWPGHRYFEVLLDPATSTPPRLGQVALGTFGPDANVTARRSLTLPDGAAAAAETFRVSPASPGDWYWLAKGLNLVVGGETMTIDSVDQGAGTVTVLPRPSGGVHAPGAAGVTRTGKMLWRDAADAARIYKDPVYSHAIVRPTGPWSYLASTTIPAGEAAFVVPVAQQFDPAAAATTRETLPKAMLPYALIGKICSLGPAENPTWPWLNIPITASDDLIRFIAREVRDHLTPAAGRELIVELGNEVWNMGVFKFHVMGYAMDALMGASPSGYVDWIILRQRQAVEIVRSVFAEHGRGGEVKSVMAFQTGLIGTALAAARRLGVEHDYASMAPYLDPPSTDDYTRTFNACLGDDQAGDLLATVVEFADDGVMLRKVNDRHHKALALHEQITGKALPTIYYECDLEHAAPQNGQAIAPSARARDIVHHPNYYHVQREILEIFARVGKCEAAAIYCHAIGGTGTRPRQWGLFQHPRQRWGYGDGRAGSRDNRLTRFRTAGPLDSPDADNVSTRFQALLDAHAAFLGAEPGPGPDPDPPPPSSGRPRRLAPFGSFARGFRGAR